MTDVRTKRVGPVRYRAFEGNVTLSELDDFLAQAIARLRRADAGGPPFAVFHGEVNELTVVWPVGE